MQSINMLPLPSSAPSGLEIRELTSAEIATMEHLFREAGTVLPDPATSTFIGAIEGGKVVGFIVLQLRLHAEPVYVEPGFSHVFTQLARKAEETILSKVGAQWVYLHCPAGRVSQLAQSLGFHLEPWNVLSKLVMPELPAKPAIELQWPADESSPALTCTDDENMEVVQ